MAEQYVTGILDEVEFDCGDRQDPGTHLIRCFGPFDSLAEAQAHARVLSSDPREGCVLRIDAPYWPERRSDGG